MRKIERRTFIKNAAAAATAIGSGVLAAPFAHAQEAWPSHPIKFIVPLAPGGAIDFIARQVGEVLSRTLGHQIVVENRTGAGGTIGMDMAMKSPPDGYTVLITNDNAASAPHIMGLSYDYTKELAPVAYLGRQSQIMAVHSSIGVNSVKELVDYVKANPGLGYATSGVGSNQHVVGAWFAKETGLKMDHVPYRGAGQAINDLIAAHVKLAFLGPTALMPHHKAGTVKLLAQSASKRAPTLQEVPTLEEAGYRGLVLDAWYAAFVPKGTPPAIVARMNSVANEVIADPAVKKRLAEMGASTLGGSSQQLAEHLAAETEKWGRLVRDARISAQ